MTRHEDQAQQIVADIVVERGVEIRHGQLLSLDLAAEFLVFALEPRVSAEVIYGTMFGGVHEPGTRVVRNARLRPLLQSGDKSILREVLGYAEVPHDAR